MEWLEHIFLFGIAICSLIAIVGFCVCIAQILFSGEEKESLQNEAEALETTPAKEKEMVQYEVNVQEQIMVNDTRLVVCSVRTKREGCTFLEALKLVDEINHKFGIHARLIRNCVGEAVLSKENLHVTLEPFSPFWTSTVVAYESRTRHTLGEEISGYHHQKDEPLTVLKFMTEEFEGDSAHTTLVFDGVTFTDLTVVKDCRHMVIKPKGKSIKIDGIPDHPKELCIHEETGVPNTQSKMTSKRWYLRRDRPRILTGGPDSEAVNPFIDNHVAPVVRSAPLKNATEAHRAFVADQQIFERYGVLIEMTEEDFLKYK